MTQRRHRDLLPGALATLTALGALGAGCIERPLAAVDPRTQSGDLIRIGHTGVGKVDLLLEVDNSRSMEQNQQNIVAQLQPMIERLTHPPDTDGDGRPDYLPVRDLHVGIVSSDLGTPGYDVGSCGDHDGDDGLLNPIARGPATRTRPPPASFRGADCLAPDQYPSFLAFTADGTHAADFSRDFRCNAALHIGGCGLEQQLEAVYRALVTHRADDRPDNTDPNAGFLRADALLAIVLLTDEEDGSVRPDARDVWNEHSTRWAGDARHMNSRFYHYQPGGPQDPTFPLERYVDPRDLSAGLLGLKPGRPDRVVFAAITGVPLQVPSRPDGSTDWDALLGAPDPADRNNFYGRDRTRALHQPGDATGPVSMQAAPDPACPGADSRPVMPACHRGRPGACVTAPDSYFALPSRRVVEIARRLDEEPLCDGQPCRNGLVASICAQDYADAMRRIVEKIQSRLPTPCLLRRLETVRNAEGSRLANCLVRESLPAGSSCDEAAGRVPARDAQGRPMTDPETGGPVCEVQQVPVDAEGNPVTGPEHGAGWYYDTRPDPNDPGCRQRIAFTDNAARSGGGWLQLECIQSVHAAR